jgi:uncharacterized caspase-like protein
MSNRNWSSFSLTRGFRGAALVAAFACAQIKAQPGPAAMADRKALVIGNQSYGGGALGWPVNEAKSVSALLARLGFSADALADANLASLERSVDRFVTKVRAGDTVVIYYAGHAVGVRGENYLMPTDAQPRDEADVKASGYSVTRLLDRLDGLSVRTKILILDAGRAYSAGRTGLTLAPITASPGTLVAMAGTPGATVSDAGGQGSQFTRHLLSALDTPGLKLDDVFARVRGAVSEATGGKQQPWTSSGVSGDVLLNLNPVPAPALAAAPTGAGSAGAGASAGSAEVELAFWNSIKESKNALEYEAYLRRFPNGVFAELARLRVDGLNTPRPTAASAPNASSAPVAAAGAAAPDSSRESGAPLAAGGAKGRVYFYRMKKFTGSALEPPIFLGDIELAKMDNGAYFAVDVDAGRSLFHSNDKSGGVPMEVLPGSTHYVRVDIASGAFKGHGALTEVVPTQGAAELKKLKVLEAKKVIDTERVRLEAHPK